MFSSTLPYLGNNKEKTTTEVGLRQERPQGLWRFRFYKGPFDLFLAFNVPNSEKMQWQFYKIFLL